MFAGILLAFWLFFSLFVSARFLQLFWTNSFSKKSLVDELSVNFTCTQVQELAEVETGYGDRYTLSLKHSTLEIRAHFLELCNWFTIYSTEFNLTQLRYCLVIQHQVTNPKLSSSMRSLLTANLITYPKQQFRAGKPVTFYNLNSIQNNMPCTQKITKLIIIFAINLWQV